MQDLQSCPLKRPFWCTHPHCLFCNWDDDRDDGASALAAHLGDARLGERANDPKWLSSSYPEPRRYVAWLCEDCANDDATVAWFASTVRGAYPEAIIVARPGRPDETATATPD